MATVTKLGPADHGRRMTLEEFETGDYEEGFKYELIDGRLYVSPLPNPDENVLERWLDWELSTYSREHRDVINFVSSKTRVFVPGLRLTTCPEPDLAAYNDFPLGLPFGKLHWRDLSPLLVVEVMTGDNYKDMVRNTQLYLQVPTVREYWVLDAGDDPERPTLIQHRRHGRRWVVHEFPFGSTFKTRLLPGFSLVIDPRR
jgi:Uma2 family endonuclease